MDKWKLTLKEGRGRGIIQHIRSRLYFPESKPLASGDQIVVPRPKSLRTQREKETRKRNVCVCVCVCLMICTQSTHKSMVSSACLFLFFVFWLFLFVCFLFCFFLIFLFSYYFLLLFGFASQHTDTKARTRARRACDAAANTAAAPSPAAPSAAVRNKKEIKSSIQGAKGYEEYKGDEEWVPLTHENVLKGKPSLRTAPSAISWNLKSGWENN